MMQSKFILGLLTLVATSTMAVHAEAPAAPGTLSSSDTCNGAAINNGFFALDLDADGSSNPFTDGALLIALMDGTLNVKLASGKTMKATFSRPLGVRRELEKYYRDTLLNLGLDVDGNGKVDPDTDGKAINLSMMEGAPISTIEKAAAPGFKVNFAQLAKLKNTKVVCYGGRANFLDSAYALQPTAHHFVNWGGDGLVWMYSKTLKNWMYMDRKGDVYEWVAKSNPVQGKLVQRGMDVYYSAHPEILVDIAK